MGRGDKVAQDAATLTQPVAEETSGITHQQVSRWAKRLKAPDTYRAKLFGKAYAAAMECKAATVRGTEGTGENEWYTPPKHIDAVRQLFGGVIDLDPASSAAAHFFSRSSLVTLSLISKTL
jgi:hypothetical protein